MFAIFKEDRVKQPHRSARIVHAWRLRTKAESSGCPNWISPETQWQVFPHRLSGVLNGMPAALREWRRRKNDRLELARFDDRMLRDIGLTRADGDYEINKPFWRE
jgi:uncharacterized protein YjiS (DUF1127 family)